MLRLDGQPHARRNGQAEDRQVDHVLVAVGDGTLRKNFLELAEGHHAAGEGEEAEQRFEDQGDHDRAMRSGSVILGRADQRGG